MGKRTRFNTAISYAILAAIAILFAIPLAWLLISAFNPTAVRFFEMPSALNLENFRRAWADPRTAQGFANSLILSVAATAMTVALAIMAAYPLSRYALKIGSRISMAMLFLTAIPIMAVMVPVYQLFISLKLVDTLRGVALFMTTCSLPYAIWMTKNFIDAVPIEMEEAAWIDGASRSQSIVRVVLPLMLPGLSTVTIFAFVGNWGNFFVPFILLIAPTKMPAAVNLLRFFGNNDIIDYGALAAYSLVYITPCFALYFIAQNHMSKGFTMAGGAKG
jgi:multiple sugar transport system permease protein